MRNIDSLVLLVMSALAALWASAASAAHVVETGSIAEGGFGVATAETLTRDGCGTLLNLFHGKWTPEKIRAVGEHCRKHDPVAPAAAVFIIHKNTAKNNQL